MAVAKQNQLTSANMNTRMLVPASNGLDSNSNEIIGFSGNLQHSDCQAIQTTATANNSNNMEASSRDPSTFGYEQQQQQQQLQLQHQQLAAQKCAQCRLPIKDRFIFNVIERNYHKDCIRCADCSVSLNDKCYTFENRLYCRQDFWHRFGPKCIACQQPIKASELVQRLKGSLLFHLGCFSCRDCKRPLQAGDQLHLIDNKRLLCERDFIQMSKTHTGSQQAALNKSASNSSNGSSSSSSSNNNSNSNSNILSSTSNNSNTHHQKLNNSRLQAARDANSAGAGSGSNLANLVNGSSGNQENEFAASSIKSNSNSNGCSQQQQQQALSKHSMGSAQTTPSEICNLLAPNANANQHCNNSSSQQDECQDDECDDGNRQDELLRDDDDELDELCDDLYELEQDSSEPPEPSLQASMQFAGHYVPANPRLSGQQKAEPDSAHPTSGQLSSMANSGKSVASLAKAGALASQLASDCDDSLVDANGKRRGPRTTIKPKQLETLRRAFETAPKPSRHIREQLANDTGLNMRVIQVWFQNRRSKERRMKNSNGSARRNFFRSTTRRLRVVTGSGGNHSPSLASAGPLTPNSNGGQQSLIASGAGSRSVLSGGGANRKGANATAGKHLSPLEVSAGSANDINMGSASMNAGSQQTGPTSNRQQQQQQQQQHNQRQQHNSPSDFGSSSNGGYTYFSDSSNQGDTFAMNSASSANNQPNAHTPPQYQSQLEPTTLMALESAANGHQQQHQSPNGQQQQQQQQNNPRQATYQLKNTPPPQSMYQPPPTHMMMDVGGHQQHPGNQLIGHPALQHPQMMQSSNGPGSNLHLISHPQGQPSVVQW